MRQVERSTSQDGDGDAEYRHRAVADLTCIHNGTAPCLRDAVTEARRSTNLSLPNDLVSNQRLSGGFVERIVEVSVSSLSRAVTSLAIRAVNSNNRQEHDVPARTCSIWLRSSIDTVARRREEKANQRGPCSIKSANHNCRASLFWCTIDSRSQTTNGFELEPHCRSGAQPAGESLRTPFHHYYALVERESQRI
jgi:hypothetical protein